MTRTIKWFTLPAISLGALSLAFSAGVFVDHTAVSQAQFVTRQEYTKDLTDARIRFLTDSMRQDALHDAQIQRLSRIERIVLKMACHDFPTECDR